MPNILTKSNPTSELHLSTHEIIAPSYPPTEEFYSPDSSDSYSVSVCVVTELGSVHACVYYGGAHLVVTSVYRVLSVVL